MKIFRWFIKLIMFLLLILGIKNIQIILPILFEYRKIIVIIISYLISIIIIVLNCIPKSKNNENKINKKWDNKI